jgi:hypothetical protein
MEISNQFNKFYHSRILTDMFKKSNDILFRRLIDTRTGGAFIIRKYDDYNDMDELKQLLKILNVNYGVNVEKDCKISTTDIEVKELLNHIEWVLLIASQNGIELDMVREEWDRLINATNR